MEILIREMGIQHAEPITMLSVQLGYNQTQEEIRNQIAAVNAHKDNCAFVIVHEGLKSWDELGFKTIRIESRPFIEIGGLVVDVIYRVKGVGKMLVNKIKEWCLMQNISSLRVRCNKKRTAAHQFNHSAGFSEIKVQKVFGLEIK